MPISGQYVAIGSSATLVACPLAVKQIDFEAKSDNTASAFIGPSTVTSAGVNAYAELEAGKSWGIRGQENEEISLGGPALYVNGTSGDKVFIIWVT